MTTSTKPVSVEAELLARLGLPADASSQQVEATHDELVGFLDKAPTDLRSWARREIAVVDEAFALLSDPTIDRSAVLAPAVAATAPVSAATAPSLPGTVAAGGFTPEDEELAELSGEHPATSQGRRAAKRQARTAATSGAAGVGAPAVRRRSYRGLAIGAAVLVGAVVIGVVGFNLNGGTGVPPVNGTPAPEASGPAIDQAQLGELMKKIAADPKDVTSLQALSDLYYQAGDYATASTWLDKILAVDGKNVIARLALGAAMFNQSKPAEAEKQWRLVIAADPKNVEAYYDLGFMYLSQNPPDTAKVREAWTKVIEIAPNSDVAKTVATHLQQLQGSPAPSEAAPSGAAPSPDASAAPSPAPSN